MKKHKQVECQTSPKEDSRRDDGEQARAGLTGSGWIGARKGVNIAMEIHFHPGRARRKGDSKLPF